MFIMLIATDIQKPWKIIIHKQCEIPGNIVQNFKHQDMKEISHNGEKVSQLSLVELYGCIAIHQVYPNSVPNVKLQN